MSQAQLPAGLGPATGTSEPRKLHGVLRDATRRWRGARLFGTALRGVAVWIVALLVAVGLDAALSLPGWGLVLVDVALLAVAVGLGVALLRGALRSKHDARRTAVALEHHGDAAPSRLINALDLAEKHGTAPDENKVSPALRRLAVAQGEAAAGDVNPKALVDRKTLQRALFAAGVAGLLLLSAVVTLPRVFAAVGPRLLAPLADLPPYTALRFEVAIGPEVVYVGKPAVVEVTLTHPDADAALPAEANLVRVADDGTTTALPMHRTFPEPSPDSAAIALDNASGGRFAMRFERVDEPITFYIDTPAGRSKRYTLAPDTTPLFESLHATNVPPDYTGFKTTTQRLSVLDGPASGNEVRALRGSALTLTAQSNVPLAVVSLAPSDRPDDAQEFIGGYDDGRAADATLVVGASGMYTLRLTGEDGKASQQKVTLDIAALPDTAPSVDIVHPEPVAYAVEGYPVRVRVVAKDDVGVASLQLHASLEDRALPAVALSPDTPAQRADRWHELDLPALEAAAGDTVRYFATARDNLPTAHGGPPNDVGQLAETPVFRVQIITQEDWDELARTQYGIEEIKGELETVQADLAELAEARAEALELLEALQEKVASGQPLNDVERQQARDLEQQLAEFSEKAEALAEALKQRAEMPPIYEFEPPYQQQLKELAEQLEKQSEQAEDARQAVQGLSAGGVTPTQAEELKEQARAFRENDQPFDEAEQQDLELLAHELLMLDLAAELMHHAERIRAVIIQQRELEAKLAELRDTPAAELNPEERQRLAGYAEKQSALRDELEDAALMLRETAELAGPLLPKMSGTSIYLCDKIDEIAVYADMEQAAQYMALPEPGRAHATALVAADKLETLLSDCQGVGGQSEFDLDGCLSLPKMNLQNALQQMTQSMNMGMGNKAGGMGAGMAGNMSTASLIGPRMMGSRGESRSADSARGDGRANRAAFGETFLPEGGEAEVLNPESTDARGRSAVAVPGVPARYQDIAAAYFQRLADEAARADD